MKPIHNILKFVVSTIVAAIICYTTAGQSIKTPLNQTVYTETNWDTAPLIATWEALAASWIYNHSSSAQRLAAATSNYNCHSYAWNVSDGGRDSNTWINYSYNGGANVSKFWTNDVYSSGNGVDEYCKLFYGTTADHSAITTNTPGVVRSKWGWWGLYQHSIADCPFQDSPVYTYYSSPISGNDLICTSNTYSATDISGASSYTWTGDKISTTGSGYSITATSTSYGEGWIHAEIYSPYSGTTFGTAKKVIWSGGPPTPDISGPISPRCGYTYTYRVDKTSKSVGQSFYWESDILGLGSPYSSSCTATPYMDGEGYISCTVTSCGVSQTGSMYVLAKLCDGYNLKIAPNPADDHVEITLTEKSPPENATSDKISNKPNDNPTFTIRVSTFTGNVVYTSQKTPKKFTIPVSNLQNGNYFIDVTDGKNNYRQQLIIKH